MVSFPSFLKILIDKIQKDGILHFVVNKSLEVLGREESRMTNLAVFCFVSLFAPLEASKI